MYKRQEYYHGPQDIPPEHRIFAYPEKAEPVHSILAALKMCIRDRDQNIPMTNYGILIAYIQGILKRSVEPFPAVSMMLTEEPS